MSKFNIRERVGIHAYGSGSLEQQAYARKFGVKLYQVFWGNPQRYWARKEDPVVIQKFRDQVSASEELVISHAPYLINLADDVNTRNWKMSLKSLQSISQACVDRGVKYLVVHAGSDKGRGVVNADYSWHVGLEILQKEFPSIIYCIENSAYKSNVYSSLGNLYALVGQNEGTMMCLDLAHYWSAGGDFVGAEYEKLLAMREWIGVIHLNNHPLPKGGNIDRHTDVGLLHGMIPIQALSKVVKDFTCPMIMELDSDVALVEGSYQDLEVVHNYSEVAL